MFSGNFLVKKNFSIVMSNGVVFLNISVVFYIIDSCLGVFVSLLFRCCFF